MKNNIPNHELLHSIILSNKFGRYFEDVDLPKEDSIKYAVDSAIKLINKEEIEILTSVNTKGVTEGIIIFRVSEWDTSHFGKKTVIIEHILPAMTDVKERERVVDLLLIDFYAWCKSNNVEFVTAKVSSLDLAAINALERIGFNFIESWIYNKYDLRRHIVNSANLLEIRLAKKTDLDYMLKFSKDAFSTQRFHADKNISYEKAESLYHKWIITSFTDVNQKILVYEHNGIPSAFMIYYLNDLSKYFNLKFVMWKMALLNPAIKGKGIGARFFESLFNYHCDEGCDLVDSGLSLRNIVSLNTHTKVNFKVICTLTNLHLWIKER